MPGVFGLPEISMLQAAGLFILSKIIFTPGMGGGSKSHKKSHGKDMKWKSEFRNKFRPEMERCRDKQADKDATVDVE